MDRALGWVLLLYPRPMRRRYGTEIVELTRDLIRLERRSPVRLLLSLAAHGLGCRVAWFAKTRVATAVAVTTSVACVALVNMGAASAKQNGVVSVRHGYQTLKVGPPPSTLTNADDAGQNAELAQQRARERLPDLASAFRRTAQALDKSAELAEAHARRHERRGQSAAAEEEWRAAAHARAAAAQARAYSEHWRHLDG